MQFIMSDASAADAKPAAADATATTETSSGAPFELTAEKMMTDNLLILGLLFFIFYFILIRPQQKRIAMQKEMMKGLAKGNRIMTTGGLFGTISKFEGDDVVVLEIATNVKIRVTKAAIAEVVTDKAAPGEIANDN